MIESNEPKRRHVRHVWMNSRYEQRRAAGEPMEHSLYEFMRAMEEVKRLPHWLKLARTDSLPVLHQQCSRSEPEPIVENKLYCALKVNVTECPILAGMRATFQEWSAREYYSTLTEDDADQTAAEVCAWHIFISTLTHPGIDTFEGYMQDESDRMFWRTTYENMAAMDDEPDEGDDDE